MRTLHVTDETGDTQYNLDTDTAKDVFIKAMLNGKLAYMRVDGENQQIRTFEETKQAERVAIISAQAGG